MANDLAISNPHPRKLAGPQLLHELVPAEGHDGAPAIEYASHDGSTTRIHYHELHNRSDNLAARIANVRRQSNSSTQHFVVPILIPQCPELYIAQLATLKAGGAFCPIVLDAPEERLRFILSDVQAHVLLTTATFQHQLPHLDGITIIAVDDPGVGLDQLIPPASSSISPHDAAYVMYTSGSTGLPKGVLLSHLAATQALLAHDLQIPVFSRFLQFASPTFDVSVFEIFFPWLRRATLVSCDRRRLLNDLPATINELAVDACELTPSVVSSLLGERERVPSLKLLLTIGEMLKISVVQAFGGDAETSGILHGMYGPTEATIHCTLQTHFSKDMSCGNIGIPLDTVSAFVVKARENGEGLPPSLEILRIGEEGELAVGGYQLADGYLNREEQTRAAFVSHPQYGMLYRTGDRVRMTESGRLECLGRLSTGQVKLRGQRIELGEIEHAASQAPGCRDVVAEVISGILVVFAVTKPGADAREKIIGTCKDWLPSFMIPGDVVTLDRLPYLASGKCDRQALRKLYEQQQEQQQQQQQQQQDSQPLDHEQDVSLQAICQIISRVLDAHVSSKSTLAGSSLDSLSAIRVASELRKAGFAQLNAARILTARTPRDIVSALDSMKNSTRPSGQMDGLYRQVLRDAIANIIPQDLSNDLETAFPCTLTQIAMLTETEKVSNMYCNWVEFWLPGMHNLDNLEEQIRVLAGLHPMIRSGFVPLAGVQWSYANIVWRSLIPSQIIRTLKFDYKFELTDTTAMLRPCSFSLMTVDGGSRLLVKFHHALYDQWSIDVFQADLSQLLKGMGCPKPESFQAVADHHLEVMAEETCPAAMEFWQQNLQNVASSCVPTLRGQEMPDALEVTGWLSLGVSSEALRARAKEIGCSPPAIFQTAIAYLLGMYIGSTDVTLGSVFSGRTAPVTGIERVLGPCFATLPLRIDYSTASTVKDLLRAVTDQNRTMQEYSLVSPTTIREMADVPPGVSLFDVLFVWQQSTVNVTTDSPAVTLVDSKDQSEFKLVLEFDPSQSDIQARATYQQSSLDASHVDILLRQIDGIVAAILQDSDRKLEVIGSSLSTDLLSISNTKPEFYAKDCDLISKIREQAYRDPEACAIAFAYDLDMVGEGVISLSYSGLEERSNQIANALIESGIQPQDLVCICMEKSIDLYVTMLAVFKAGAGYLPIIPDTPQPRIQRILQQARIKHCVGDSSSIRIFRNFQDINDINIENLDLSKISKVTPLVLQSGSRIAYAVFTSGSTGEPKGVAVTMDNLQGNLAVLKDLYKTRPGDRLLQACSQAFDVSVFEIFFSFYSGICLCSAVKEVMFRDFEHTTRAFEISHLSLTPTVAGLVNPENVPTVRFLVTAGEAVTEAIHRRWAGKGLHQGYGPSETTNICSVKMYTSPKDILGNIGPPLRNTSAFVVAPQGEFRILPRGAYGEYVFGGEQVFRGYIGRDDLNLEKLIQHPVHGKLYRSGDMGRILFDGTLLISGRLDDQVKIRGNRVELGEINTIILDIPDVADCTTLVFGESSSDQMIVTFCVLSSLQCDHKSAPAVLQPGPTTISRIFEHLEERLPAYMIPSFVISVNRLPMTSQGKLDKRLLRTIFDNQDSASRESFSRSSGQSAQDPPANPVELTIAETLAEMLQVPATDVHRHSSFLALGLNSLNAIRFAKLLEKRLQVHVKVATLLRNASVARLYKALSQDGSHVDPQENMNDLLPPDLMQEITASLTSKGIGFDALLPCTPLQEVMLSASTANDRSAYCNTTRFTFSGDLQQLRNCWDRIVDRHWILRTSFLATDHQKYPFVQVVLKQPPLTWHCTVGTVVNSDGSKESNGHLNGKPHEPDTLYYQVNPGSPLRIDIEGQEICLRMHHAIFDGIAIANLLSELKSSYEGISPPPVVPPEPFLHEVRSQNEQEAIRFWSQQILGFRPHPLPMRHDVVSKKETILSQMIPFLASEIETFGERNSCTSLSLFQAAWTKTLASVQDVADLCFGNVVSGRLVPVADIERLIAPCFNTIPIRVELDALRTNMDVISHLYRKNLEILPYQLTATRHIQGLSQQPSKRLFDTLLLLQPPNNEKSAWVTKDDPVEMQIPIVLEIVPEASSFELRLQYMSERISSELAGYLVEAFISSLGSCLRYPANSITHFHHFNSDLINGKMRPTPSEPTSNGNIVSRYPREKETWSSEEGIVRESLAQLARVDPQSIAKQTSLYQIGLDSLNAVQLSAKLRSRGLNVDAADVMRHQTPAAIAVIALKRKSEDKGSSQAVGMDFELFEQKYELQIVKTLQVDRDDIEAIRPCTPMQNGMLAQFIQSQGALYLGHITYEIPKQYNLDRIIDAWSRVQCKHQVLRMGFYQTDDGASPFAMVIYRHSASLSATIISESEVVKPSTDKEVSQEIIEHLHGPVWRLCLTDQEQCRTMRLSLHHALYDAESLQTILKDFRLALNSEELGQASMIDSLLKEQLDSASLHKDESKGFWTTALSSCRSSKFPNLVPTAISKPGASSIQLASEASMEALSSFCAQEHVTVQALGQGVWAMLLAEYLGEPHVTFGTVFASFSSTAESIAFPGVSTLPVYCDTSKARPADIIRDMVTFNASAQRHRFLPLSDIQRQAGVTTQSLFDTIFIYQKRRNNEHEFEWHVLENSLDVDFAASMELEASSQGSVSLRLTFRNSIIPETHASLILQHYDMILISMLNNIPRTHPQYRDLLSHAPPKEATLPCSVHSLHEFVERGAVNHPDKTALEFILELNGDHMKRKTWTYQQLNERSNQVAHLIQRHHVKPGSVIAVCMTKSAEASFAFVGILKAGCAFLAMDPDLPIARRRFILEDSSCQLLFVNSGTSDPELENILEMIDLTEQILADMPFTAVDVPLVEASATCYCLYTSGTTGTPKGCELTHENAVQAMMSFQRLFLGHWTASSRWLQFASYWFDVSVLEQFWSWSVGITVVGAPRDLVLEDVSGFIRQADITHIDLTPSLARLVKPEDVPSLHHNVFITGGEALKQEIINAWGPYKTICNGYGPTEATIGVTMNRFIGTDAKPSNIGPPFDNVGTYVLKPGTDEIVLRGAIGELCVSGKLVGKGYLNRPELTAQCFPYLERYGERVYRTGDLVRLLVDGSVSFVGRADTQTKLRGQRLEIDEIDSVIKKSSPGITDVASLVTKSDSNGREMLVSFIIDSEAHNHDLKVSSSQQSSLLVRQAVEACENSLPGYMVPTHFIPVSRLPLTVNNKVDLKPLIGLFSSLSNLDLQQLKGQGASDRSLSSTETKVAKVLSRLLSIDHHELRPNSNVFSAGLSSITAISFASQLKRNGFKGATVAMVMKTPTLARLAESLTADASDDNAIKQAQLSLTAFGQRNRGNIAQLLSTDVSKIESLAPCTPLQTGLLTESLKDAKRPYFNHFWYDISHLDINNVRSAVLQLQAQVNILRTTFVRTDEGFCQVIVKCMQRSVPILECDSKDIELQLTKLNSQWKSSMEPEMVQPFEVHILQSAEKAILSFHTHHALYDGISWELTVARLESLYKGRSVIHNEPTFNDALPYGPMCSRPGEEPFWRTRLHGIYFKPLPFVNSDGDDGDVSLQRRLPFIPGISKVRQKLGVAHQAIFQTAFEIALHQLSPATSCYGTVLSGRSINLEGADIVIGPLFNTVPFVLDLVPSNKWSQQLQKAQQSSADYLPFQHSPLRDIRKACGRPSSEPLFDVLFVFQRSTTLEESKDDIAFKHIDTESSVEYPLAFEITLDPSEDMRVHVAAQGTFAKESTLRELVDNFEAALHEMSQDLEKTISDSFRIEASSTREIPQSNSNSKDEHLVASNDAFTWTEDATVLRRIIAELAGCWEQDVTEHSTIFTLGLDSIDTVKLASRFKKFNVTIPVSEILKAQTIPRMLQKASVQRREAADQSKHVLVSELEHQLERLLISQPDLHDNVERILPATPGQEALVADMIRSNFQDYYNSDILRLREDIDVSKLKVAWQQVVKSSPILRTSFLEVIDPTINVTFAQLIHYPGDLDIIEASLDSLKDVEKYLSDVRRDVSLTFSTKPPLRLAIFKVQSDHFLVLSLAHAQYDGHSLALVHEDINKAYHGSVPPRPMYEDFIERALNATDDASSTFWRSELSGAKVRLMSDENSLGKGQTHRAEHISKIQSQLARDICKTYGISMQALAGASWALVHAHYLHELEVITGVVLACRDSEDAEAVMFPTMNTIPVRTIIHGSSKDFLQHFQRSMNTLRRHQRTPLRAIQSFCAGVVQSGRGGNGVLFDTLFTYQHRPESAEQCSEALYESVDSNSNVEYSVAVELEIIESKVMLRAAVKDHILNNIETEDLLKQFEHVLSYLITSPDESVIEFTGSLVSVCDLPAFTLQYTNTADESLLSLQNEADDENGANFADSAHAAIIRSVLAQVSKLSEGEILPHSTVESIGIDSISAIKVSALLRQQSIKLSVSEILKAQTLRRMVEAVETKTGSSTPIREPSRHVIGKALHAFDIPSMLQEAGIDADAVETIMPALPGQVYMLSLWKISNGELFFPIFDYEIDTNRSIDDLRNAWKELVSRFPILRTTFITSTEGSLLQVVLKTSPTDLQEGENMAITDSNIQQPLVQVHMRRRNGGYTIALKIHHALYDAVSLQVLVQSFESILDNSLPSTPRIDFADYVALSLPTETLSSRKDFWTQYLSNVQPLQLKSSGAGKSRKVELFEPDAFTSCASLLKLARKAQVTAQALLFAIYAKTYSAQAISGDGDVVFGIYVANRSHFSDLDGLAAPTLNLLPLLIRSPRNLSTISTAKTIDSDLRKITSTTNSGASLAEIVQWTGVKVDSFVNFLKLPNVAEAAQAEQEHEYHPSNASSSSSSSPPLATTTITPVKNWEGSISRVRGVSALAPTNAEVPAFRLPQELQAFKPSDAYQHALDVELSMPPDNRTLSIGLFCREDILDLDEAEGMLRAMKGELSSLVEGDHDN